MSDAPSLAVFDPHPLTLVDKALVWGALLAAGYLFLTVGWTAMRPDDPLGAVSLLSRRGALMMVLQAGALAAVAAALGTVLAGRKLVDVGSFAASVGVTVATFRVASIEPLLLAHANSGGSPRGLGVLLAVEAVCWLVVAVLVLLVSGLVMRWCFDPGRRAPTPGPDGGHTLSVDPTHDARILAAYDLGAILPLPLGGTGYARTPLGDGVRHMLITAFAAVVAFNIVATGWSARSIQHGQVCFIVAASICAGCYVAHRMVPVKSALWGVFAAGLVAVAGYVWAAARPGGASELAAVPASNFLRILPIQCVFVGTASAIAMLWYMHLPEEDPVGSDSAAGAARSGGS